MLPIPAFMRSPRCLVLALTLILPAAASAAGDDPGCPVGVLKCPPKPLNWAMCTKNDLLDFYVPGLPTEGDRNAVAQDISALRVSSPDRTSYLLEGDAEIRQLDLLLRANKLTYHTETTAYSAVGQVRYQDRSVLLSADDAHGNTDLDQCTLNGVRYQLLSSRGNGIAQVAVMDDRDHARLTGATYTTCDIRHQQWAFGAREMNLDREEGVGRARDVTLRVFDVPVFWVPYLRFPLDERRLSGVLVPSIGFGERRGFDLTVPYYLNLAPNYDATLSPRLMTERGLMLGGEFRYLTDSSRGSFNADYLSHDRRANDEALQYGQPIPDSRWWYRWRNNTTLGSSWGATVDINRVSDARYFEDFGRGLYSSAISFLPSNVYFNGQGDWWTASIGGDRYQITDPTLSDRFEPYQRLPRALFNAEHGLVGDLRAGLNAEFVAFGRDRALEGQRLDLYPFIAWPIETSAYFLRPEIGYRYTGYSLDHMEYSNNPLLTDRRPSRGVPIFSLDTGLIFERSLHFGDAAWTQTLEPRAYYLRVPYRDQADLPVFDTQEIPFSFGQLFRTNRFVGADRQMDANNLSLALTTRFLENASGEERVSASIGQIHYFDEQRVQLPGPGPSYEPVPTDFSGSVYAGEIDLHLSKRWRVVLAQQWNPNTKRTDLSTVSVQNRFGNDGIVNFSYRYRRDFLEQVDVSLALPITESWRFIARENYALNNPLALPSDPRGTRGRTLESFIGLEHESCCVAWRVLARRWIHNAAGESDNAI